VPDLLVRLQRGLESLYRISTGVDVGDFVVDDPPRDVRRAREQLLVREADGELSLGLFIDRGARENLARNDPGARLGEHNFGDFLLAVEGVSHFVMTAWCAAHDRAVSPLELELQAEVDKYVTCLLELKPDVGVSEALRRRLFRDFAWEPDLDDDERDRYRAANDHAHRYATWLEQRFVEPRRIPDMLGELRVFYRRSLARKLDLTSVSRTAG
jgi:hypothetical protein